MSDSTESSDSNGSALALYLQAINAFEQGKLEYSWELCREAARLYELAGNDDVSDVYVQLGLIAYWRKEFDAADEWYRKALDIKERKGDEVGSATTYHYLSAVAKSREDFDAADMWLWKSLQVREKQGDEIGAAECYHQMGLVGYGRGDLDSAEHWYRKSLEIDERNGDEHGAAKTYNNLSAVANERKDFDSAEKCLWKSIHIKEKEGDERGVAVSYHQLGFVAYSRQDLHAAEQWYFKALEIKEQLNDELGMAETYVNLGNVADDQGDREAAAEWRRKALCIFERNNDASRVILLAKIAQHGRRFGDAEALYHKALSIAKKTGSVEFEARSSERLGALADQQRDYEAAIKWYEKSFEADERRGALDLAAKTCICLGNLCLAKDSGRKNDFVSAKKWFRKALEFNANATWRDWLTLHARLWRYRILTLLSK